MNEPRSDLLFSILALQNKFVSRDQLIEALNLWAINKKRSLAEVVQERGRIATADRDLLNRLVDRQLEVDGDIEASLCESQGVIELAEHCSRIDDFELRDRFQSIASRAAKSQLAKTRLSGSVSPAGTVGNDNFESTIRSRSDESRSISSQTGQVRSDATNPERYHNSVTSFRTPNISKNGDVTGSNPSQASAELDVTAASRPNSKEVRDAPVRAKSVSLDPLASSRFSVVNSHAKGGLGEVFLARDNELDREVALKEIQHKFATDEEARIRFEFEACVTGGLEHPGVVPVYAFGKHADGRPYYAMRFIRGRSMKEEVAAYHEKIKANAPDHEQRSLLRGLLTRFVDACQAIAYAHSRGVIHRDLKPANVMLGKFGETLVVDWGLAKSVGRDEHNIGDELSLMPLSGSTGSGTLLGSTLGTPGYMSPEQASGRLNDMGPVSDIFSLGATLYNILVGTVPFEGTRANEVVAAAKENRFIEPIIKRTNTPRPLNAIVLKAMATNPKDRYHTAMELAEDVEAYLADDIVTAYRETLWERSQRWVRQHRTFATAMFVLISTVGLASAFGAVLLNSEKNKTQLALDQVSAEQKKTNLALTALIEEQAKTELALTAETRARRQTREMLNTISDDLVGELLGRQAEESKVANQKFFDRVLGHFEQFTGSLDSSSEAKNLRADGFFRVANLQRRLARLDQAQKSYSQAIDIWKKLAAEFPSNLNYQQDLAAAQANLGLAYADRANFPAALEQYTVASKLFSDLLVATKSAPAKSAPSKSAPSTDEGDDSNPSSETKESNADETLLVSTASNSLDPAAIEKVESKLASLNVNLANTLLKLNRRAEAEPHYKLALEGSAKIKANSTEASADRARILGNYASYVASVPGRLPEARKLMEEAVETLSSGKLAEDGKLPPNFRLDLAQYRKGLGKILVALKEKDLAIDRAKATVKDLDDLANEYPAVANYRRELATNQIELAVLLRDEQLEQAKAEFNSAIASFEKIIADNPRQFRTRLELAASIDNWGSWLAESDFSSAKNYFDRARQLRLELHQTEPENPTFRDHWIVGEINWADKFRTRKEYATAIEIFTSVIEELEKSDKPEEDPLYPIKLRQSRFGLAESLSKTDQFAAALPIWTQLVENRQDENWVNFEFQRAICLIRTGDTDDGLTAAKALVDVEKPEPVWLYDMACCYAIANEISIARKDDSQKGKYQRKEWSDAALKYLNLAGEAEFFESEEMREHAVDDKDLNSIRDHADFKAFRDKFLNAGDGK